MVEAVMDLIVSDWQNTIKILYIICFEHFGFFSFLVTHFCKKCFPNFIIELNQKFWISKFL